ncbi:MAG: hypothetical protein QM774_11625 [Gordonia sp. (in: high G+C Gram-positive bacteria)]|uniref:hypothetical protein n=1 Tax=Gordonia sp. (in: high G+C Gram-positive bacteria) TaxID=84139 RepID=UPI0039E3B43C
MTRDVPGEDATPDAAATPDTAVAATDEKHHLLHRHADESAQEVQAAADDAKDEKKKKKGLSLKTKLIFTVIGIGLIVGLYFWFRQMAPRWWGTTVSGWVHDEFARGVWFGLLFGIFGAALALILFLLSLHEWMKRRQWLSVPLGILSIGALVPILLTLAVVRWNTSGADAAKQDLNQFGPGFRGAMVVGVIIGIVVGVFVDYLLLRHHRNKTNPTD